MTRPSSTAVPEVSQKVSEEAREGEPVRWYHGTRRGFTRGGYVTDREFHQGAQTSAPLKPGRQSPEDVVEHTYLTTNPVVAWVYAWHAPGRGKPKVLRVEPMGPVSPDPEHSPAMEAYRCAGWLRVVGVETEPLITEAEARAGWV